MTKRRSVPRKRVSALRWRGPGKASIYICHAPDAIGPGDPVIICPRVSRCAQGRNGNLANQEANLRAEAKRLRAKVVGVEACVGDAYDPTWLSWALALAEQKAAKLLFESTDRIIRTPAFHSSRSPNSQPTELDFKMLRQYADSVTLATVLHPDATPSEVRSYQRKRGQAAKGRKGGRPPKQPRQAWKLRKQAPNQLAKELHDNGLSYRLVALLLNTRGNDGFPDVSHTTILNWLKKL